MKDITLAPELKCKEEHVFTVESNDLDAFVEAVYGREYESVAHNEWDDGSCYKIGVHQIKALDSYEQPQLSAFQTSGATCSAWVIMQDLLNRGLIKPGSYLIKVYW